MVAEFSVILTAIIMCVGFSSAVLSPTHMVPGLHVILRKTQGVLLAIGF